MGTMKIKESGVRKLMNHEIREIIKGESSHVIIINIDEKYKSRL